MSRPREYEALKRLRVVRHFRPEPVPDEVVEAILDAARWTGSAKNRQDWRFVVITDPDQIARLAECGDFTEPMRRAPLVIAVVGLPGSYEWDLGRVSQTIMLAAAALGVGSVPQTMHRHDCARRVLGVPDDHWCRVVIALGYPDREAEASARAASPFRGRLPLSELVFRDRYQANTPAADTPQTNQSPHLT
ncbi:MAG: nitroreductase [Acidimicrobiia bacterium]|nr:MAG: nitroreductase [Acidimicrobiia bacterium]